MPSRHQRRGNMPDKFKWNDVGTNLVELTAVVLAKETRQGLLTSRGGLTPTTSELFNHLHALTDDFWGHPGSSSLFHVLIIVRGGHFHTFQTGCGFFSPNSILHHTSRGSK